MSSVYTVTQGPSHLGFIYPSTPLSAPRLDSTATSSTSETISPETLQKLTIVRQFLENLNKTLYQKDLRDLVNQCEEQGNEYLLKAEILDLSCCQLEELPEEFDVMTNVRELCLLGNKLTDLPKSLISMRSLRLIRLEGNKFKHLPEVIYRIAMDRIQNGRSLSLHLYNNPMQYVPKSLEHRVRTDPVIGSTLYSSCQELFPYKL